MSYFDDNEDRIIFGGHGSRRLPRYKEKREVVCKTCGHDEGLVWRQMRNSQWRLFDVDTGELHSCAEHRSGANIEDDFEVLL